MLLILVESYTYYAISIKSIQSYSLKAGCQIAALQCQLRLCICMHSPPAHCCKGHDIVEVALRTRIGSGRLRTAAVSNFDERWHVGHYCVCGASGLGRALPQPQLMGGNAAGPSLGTSVQAKLGLDGASCRWHASVCSQSECQCTTICSRSCRPIQVCIVCIPSSHLCGTFIDTAAFSLIGGHEHLLCRGFEM